MTQDELIEKMLAYIDTQPGDSWDEWYATRRDFASEVLQSFAEYLNIELVVPEYVPTKTRNLAQEAIDRKRIFESFLPEIEKLFGLKYEEMKRSNDGQD